MELTTYSENRLWNSLQHWRVCKDFADPMFNYLVYGISPGGFFSSWYANDVTAILHCHPANTVESLKDLTKWMVNCMPHEAWGTRDRVQGWLKLVTAERRKILEERELVYSEQDEIMMSLKGYPSNEPGYWY